MAKNTSPFKRMLLSTIVIVTYGSYALRQYMLGGSQSSLIVTSPFPVASTQAPFPSPPLPTKTPTPTPAGQYRDGQYTGSTADAFYGPLQVKAIIQNGKLADIQFLQYPNDRSRSIEINNYALPILRTEAINTQNAQVDAVTGASASSPAFAQSLSSALAQAHT